MVSQERSCGGSNFMWDQTNHASSVCGIVIGKRMRPPKAVYIQMEVTDKSAIYVESSISGTVVRAPESSAQPNQESPRQNVSSW